MAALAGKVALTAFGGKLDESTTILTLAMYLDTDPDHELTDQSLSELARMSTDGLPYTRKVIEG